MKTRTIYFGEQPKRNVLQKAFDKSKAVYTKNVKPAVTEGLKYTKNLSKDAIDFIKNNPKTVSKYAAAGLFAASAIALGVKAVKDFFKTKKQNEILTKAFINQRETINDLKEINTINRDIIAAKDKRIEELQK